ncbi:MAG: KTSC domain-containing protein [Fimbriimonadaceae bacterium]|nr:KTSC domain-containing protein [Fimbriimonadaceae bacterium]QYK56628.1 MAG: KTSC domain-containing protein [Fimbriimonadaceae bacterium]
MKSVPIESVGYDLDGQVMHVRMHSGAVYGYSDCPPVEFVRLAMADAPGAYFHANIRGAYPTSVIPTLQVES